MKENNLNDEESELLKKDYFMQVPAKVAACDYHKGLDLVVVGFSNGVFGVYQMPDSICIHLLSISRKKITVVVFNDLGNWLTFGCAKLGQLLVWEWKSESYILKHQGHYYNVNCLAYFPNSQPLARAGDNKVKVWNVSSGFCFVTFPEHANAVTALYFMANNHWLLSASKDVARQYVYVTRMAVMPPLLATAYHQCRWNYRDREDVCHVDSKFDEYTIPYDVLWLDNEHTDEKRYFTWDRVLLSSPKEMQNKLAASLQRKGV